MRRPSTRMICCSGSTLAPYLRTISPSTSTRPSPISSSQYRRLPRPAAASTFCSRTPPGTSVSESRSPSSKSAGGLRRDPLRALLIPPAGGLLLPDGIYGLPHGLASTFDLVREEGGE